MNLPKIRASRVVVRGGFARTSKVETLWRSLKKTIDYPRADTREPASMSTMVQAARRAFASFDTLADCAEMDLPTWIDKRPAHKWQAIIAMKWSVAVRALLLPSMTTKAWGRIVGVGAAHSLVLPAFKFAVFTARRTIVGQTKVAVLQTAKQGATGSLTCTT